MKKKSIFGEVKLYFCKHVEAKLVKDSGILGLKNDGFERNTKRCLKNLKISGNLIK